MPDIPKQGNSKLNCKVDRMENSEGRLTTPFNVHHLAFGAFVSTRVISRSTNIYTPKMVNLWIDDLGEKD